MLLGAGTNSVRSSSLPNPLGSVVSDSGLVISLILHCLLLPGSHCSISQLGGEEEALRGLASDRPQGHTAG